MNPKQRRRPKLFLIQPAFDVGSFNRNSSTLVPLGLAYVAAYTPSHWDVEIHDEQEQAPKFPDADLVGITTTTGSIVRAYEIAQIYRARHIPVVLGGVHASLLPDEANQYCDSVVIGDAEPVWEDVIRDFESGSLKPRYKAPNAPLDNLRIPRRDLFHGRYLMGSISTSRGCPFRCTFCCIHNFYGDTYRMRPIEEVIDELRTLKNRVLFFTDGNLFGYTQQARTRFLELCRRIEQEKRKGSFSFLAWMAYATVNILEDEEALEAASKAGCVNLLIGFESINPDTLREMKKGINIKRSNKYRELIHNAARRGILVTAELVLGFDNDTPQTLALTRDFVRESGMDILRLQILQPLPGTEVFQELQKSNRLYVTSFPADWAKLWEKFFLGINFEVKNVDPYELVQFVVESGREFYSLPNIFKNGLRALVRQRSPLAFAYLVVFSMKSRSMYQSYELSREAMTQAIAEGRRKRDELLAQAHSNNRRHLPVVGT